MEVIAGHRGVGRRVAGGEAAANVEEVLDRDLGSRRHWKFSLCAVLSRNDVAYPQTGGLLRDVGRLPVGRRLHRGQRRDMLKGQVADVRKLHITQAVRTKTRRMCGRGEGSVVRRRRVRVVRKGGRRRRGREGRSWSRLLCHAVCVRVVVLVRVRPRHGLRRVGVGSQTVDTRQSTVGAKVLVRGHVVPRGELRLLLLLLLLLNLRGSGGQDAHGGVGGRAVVGSNVAQGIVGRVGVGRRDVWRGEV